MNFEAAAKVLRTDAEVLRIAVLHMDQGSADRDKLMLMAGRLDGVGWMLAGLKDGKPSVEPR